jgi:hypothetical protein
MSAWLNSCEHSQQRAVFGNPAGKVAARFALVRFCRMLGTLLGAGVGLIASLKVSKEAIGNQTLSDTVQFGIDEVQKGASLARALGSATQLFPGSVVEMIAIAGVAFAVNAIAEDGEVTWFEGAMLFGIYVILAIAFFFVTPA